MRLTCRNFTFDATDGRTTLIGLDDEFVLVESGEMKLILTGSRSVTSDIPRWLLMPS